jgi:hypothetical protein
MEVPMKNEITTETCTPNKGDWVVIVDNRIVACDKNPKKIVAVADKYPNSAIITKEPSTQNCYY